jgi:branched-subunit amino acid transport protein
MSGTDPWTLLTIAGLTLVTVVTRTFFLIPERPLPMPDWVVRGLHYAPIAALAAVIVPELVMSQGRLIGGLLDARLFGAAAGLLWFAWKRSILGTILCGMLVYLPLHLLLRW